MEISKLPIFIKESNITGEMQFEYFNQMIKINLSLTVNNTLYLFDTIITPEQIYLQTILPIKGIENSKIAKKIYQKKYLFNGNIIKPNGFKTLEMLTSECILLIENFNKNKDTWEEKLTDIKYSNENCLAISVKALKKVEMEKVN